ncbi:hypothetical protein ABZ635_00765 [Nocardiopsis sp. NPDC007018]|uniref:hypothetical protein n=1 Tax=Nocardiopsis sp. NPDC007018 TaxID=3155721 RepID=UPI0033FF0BC3
MSTPREFDTETLLAMTPDSLTAVGAARGGVTEFASEVADRLHKEGKPHEALEKTLGFTAPFGESWLHQPGETAPYLSLELAGRVLAPDAYRDAMAAIVLSGSPSVPFDYRALAAEALASCGAGPWTAELERVVAETQALPLRGLDTKIGIRTDGIDHLFHIPETVDQRLELLRTASALKTAESRALLARRVLERAGGGGADAPAPPADALVSAEAERLIAEDTGTGMVAPGDYLVRWDQELAVPDGSPHPLTLAELLRITLLAPEFKLPDIRVRPVLVDFYRAILRISGRVTIGLGSGVFYVEHGAQARPSYFYMGRDAVLGKGCTIDCVGGAVLQQGSFLGGGFMPVLVHTHKHIRKGGEPGVAERKRVLPCVFAAEAGARLPMDAIGIFETADYLGAPSSPHEGIRALALDT